MISKLILKYRDLAVYYRKKHSMKIGENFRGARDINFGSEPYLVEIGANFYSSTGVKFITHDGSINVLRNLKKEYKNADIINPILVGDNVFLGINCVVLAGTIIGDNVIVGAASVVKGDLESDSVYAGIPARKICTIEEYFNKNKKLILNTKSLNAVDKKKYLMNYFLKI